MPDSTLAIARSNVCAASRCSRDNRTVSFDIRLQTKLPKFGAIYEYNYKAALAYCGCVNATKADNSRPQRGQRSKQFTRSTRTTSHGIQWAESSHARRSASDMQSAPRTRYQPEGGSRPSSASTARRHSFFRKAFSPYLLGNNFVLSSADCVCSSGKASRKT